MKLLLLVCAFGILVALSKCDQVDKEEDCKCWENFKPEKDTGTGYYCRGEKHHRVFSCNEEKPPICKCEVDGKIVDLDLGETNCLTVNVKNGRWCHNRAEFAEYFRKHPEHAIYD
ncbi:uncharacterized protein LOC135126358 isoform X2 [Zophobas morio]|uniref:uncharacterized protein LOC135126358 isoform X2 n=1 Tax=Zophobas morio TaxID=2755281 RepID=UPI0030835A35